MLNMTKVTSEQISDADMDLFFEKGVRGSVSYISRRHSKTSNNYLISYDPIQESKHVIYLDTNNLYGYGMSTFLPTGGFKWIDLKEFDSNKYSSNSSKCCVVGVDLGYLKELQEFHNDCP